MCQFARYRYKTTVWKSHNRWHVPEEVFSIADDILIVGYDYNGEDHDRTQIHTPCCRYAEKKPQTLREKWHFRWTSSIPFFAEMTSRQGSQTPENWNSLMDIPTAKSGKELKAF